MSHIPYGCQIENGRAVIDVDAAGQVHKPNYTEAPAGGE